MALRYLFGGCQAVVANLWDVTDRFARCVTFTTDPLSSVALSLSLSPNVPHNLFLLRDIDRYSLALLNNIFLNNDNRTGGLCKAVAVARASCKMRFIVGHAPVCYGLPI